jgi:multicomponent K+:H+ antiporter subunit D
MSGLANHLIILPIVLPLATGAFLLLLDERRHTLKALVSLASVLLVVWAVVALLLQANTPLPETAAQQVTVYRLGSWPAPFAIVLVLDRLSAMMLVLTGILALSTLIFSLARWHRVGPHFHSLFQFLLVGLNGAFLTGDLFNLFVFFEILLAASYGLVLHGSGHARVRGGLHYIAINLAASSLFLIGISLIYGVTGTLNMADIAMQAPAIAPGDRVLFEAGMAILGVAFLVKAGMWPLGFWLPGAYAPAAAPMAAFFAIMTKVGVYIILRLSLLLLGASAGASAYFGDPWLVTGGIITVLFGVIGILAAQDLPRLASYMVVISSGTLLALIGVGDTAVTAGALFYLLSSTLAIAAFFMLIELVARGQAAGADVLAVTMEAYGETNVDEEDDAEEVTGVSIPATMAILGLCFMACALLLAGLPPLSGFIAKFVLIKALVQQPEVAPGTVGSTAWILTALLLVSGFAAVIAMVRAGIKSFWLPLDGTVPRVRVVEIVPVAGLILLCGALTIGAGPAMRFADATAQNLHLPGDYIRAVLPADFQTPALSGGAP